MFGYSNTWGKKRMFAILCETAQVIEMVRIENEEMEKLEKTDARGIPTYYTDDGRFWPKPLQYIILARQI